MKITQQFRALSIDSVNNIAIEEVSRYEACENLGDLFRIIAALHQAWKKFVLMKIINSFDVGENSMLLTAQGLRQLLSLKDVHVVCYARFQGPHVVLFVLQKLTNDVQQF